MHIVLALLLLAGPAWAVVTYEAGTLSCAVYSKGEVRREFGIKNTAGFVCTNLLTGEVLGSLTRGKTGFGICAVHGQAISDRCASVDLCADGDTSDARDVCLP